MSTPAPPAEGHTLTAPLFNEPTRGSQAVAAWLEQQAATATGPSRACSFPTGPKACRLPRGNRRRGTVNADRDDRAADAPDGTTLNRVHTGMLLQAGGTYQRAAGTRAGGSRARPRLLRLSNALSGLYRRGGEEKRLLDAMLLAVPR